MELHVDGWKTPSASAMLRYAETEVLMIPENLLEATLGRFMPHRLYMQLGGSISEYSPETAAFRGMATSVHEHAHFFQTLMTGYGHISWDSHRQATSFLIHEWLGLPAAPDGRRRLPLAHAARLGKQHLATALVTHRTVVETIKLNQARYWRSHPGVTLAELPSRLVPHAWAANPEVEVGGRTHVLQGKDIAEGHAQFVEATMLERMAGQSRAEAWDRDTLPTQYHVALDWFIEQCGEDRREDFPFVCDLAMQTSSRPILPTTEEEWRASHPAWRFVRLTEARRELKDLVLGGPAEWPTSYPAFATSLLEASKLRLLAEVFSERINAFRHKEHLLGFEQLMHDAMVFRTEFPWCGGNPIADLSLWSTMMSKFPAPIIEVEGHLSGAGFGTPSANSEILFELQFQALAAQVFGDFSRLAFEECAIECAFAKFQIDRGCKYQRSDNCTGRFDPSNGCPHPVDESDDGTLSGCSFGMLLKTIGLDSTDLDLDVEAKLPTDSELREMERLAREARHRSSTC